MESKKEKIYSEIKSIVTRNFDIFLSADKKELGIEAEEIKRMDICVIIAKQVLLDNLEILVIFKDEINEINESEKRLIVAQTTNIISDVIMQSAEILDIHKTYENLEKELKKTNLSKLLDNGLFKKMFLILEEYNNQKGDLCA